MTRTGTHLTPKRQEVQRLGEQFATGKIDKWDFYTALYCLHQPYAVLAELTGISEDVIRMRIRDLRRMS